MRALSTVVIAALGIAGCGSPTQGHGGGVQDMSIPSVGTSPDMTYVKPPAKCSPTDNLGDGQACGTNASCPTGQKAVEFLGGCKCFTTCDLNNQATCPCDRFCDPLSLPDAGTVGGACLPGNGGGERCGRDANGMPYGNGLCQQGLACVASDTQGQFRYCMYLCFGSNSQCPQETECDPLMDNTGRVIGNVCNILHRSTAKALGAACAIATDTCVLGALCDGTTCKAQCDGPKGTCAGGTTCTAVTDGTRSVGYVCK